MIPLGFHMFSISVHMLSEGFHTIENLKYTYNEKEHLVKVTDFKTRYYPKVQNVKHDLVKNGVKPFEKSPAAMKMTFH